MVRSLYECGLAEELAVWSEQSFFILMSGFLLQCVGAVFLACVVPSEILDFLHVYLMMLGLSWMLVFGYFSAGLNNIFLILSFLVWAAILAVAHLVVGSRFDRPNVLIRLPEYVISFTIFLYALSLAKSSCILACRGLLSLSRCVPQERKTRQLHECIRICFVYFGVHQVQILKAYVIMVANIVIAVLLAIADRLTSIHTWFLLNTELARTKHSDRYMEKQTTFYELSTLRPGCGLDIWSSESDSDADSRRHDLDDGGGSWAVPEHGPEAV